MPESVVRVRRREQEARFFNTAYALVRRATRIDPVLEGRRFAEAVDRVMYSDFGRLADADEVDARTARLDELTERYLRRAQRFFTLFQMYCYLRGRRRALLEAGDWMKDAERTLSRVEGRLGAMLDGES